MALIMTYYTAERRRGSANFNILVDGKKIGEQEVERSYPGKFYDIEYPVPGNLVKGKKKVTVRFEAKEDSSIATVFGIRMIRADAER